jgi:hypothetical protein
VTPKISGGITFNVDEIEAVVAAEKKVRNGKPAVSIKARKDLLKTHAAFCRALEAVGLYEQFIAPLSEMMEKFKEV